jgi:hypothetical protein
MRTSRDNRALRTSQMFACHSIAWPNPLCKGCKLTVTTQTLLLPLALAIAISPQRALLRSKVEVNHPSHPSPCTSSCPQELERLVCARRTAFVGVHPRRQLPEPATDVGRRSPCGDAQHLQDSTQMLQALSTIAQNCRTCHTLKRPFLPQLQRCCLMQLMRSSKDMSRG